VEPVDMRRGIDGLSLLLQESLGRAPADGSAYAFRNRRGTRLKRKRPTAPPSPQRFYCGILWRKGRSSSRRRWGQVGSFSSVALSQA
ncbi:MAG: transposase, partial [Burkholderiales bacterium]